MRTKRIFAVVVALGLVAGNVWPHDIASDIDVETSAEVVAEQEPQPLSETAEPSTQTEARHCQETEFL